MKAKTVKQVLEAARWMLENVGWVKYQYVAKVNGKYVGLCAFGALEMVEAENNHLVQAQDRLREEMDGSIIRFNDRPDITKRMVINAFKRAIKNGSQ